MNGLFVCGNSFEQVFFFFLSTTWNYIYLYMIVDIKDSNLNLLPDIMVSDAVTHKCAFHCFGDYATPSKGTG